MRVTPVPALGPLIFRDPDEFLTHADRWTSGTPFPLLDGVALRRYAPFFAGGKLPAPEFEPRAGRVVSVGADSVRAVGRLLAVATDRPHTHLPTADLLVPELSGHAGELVAVVALVDDLAAAGDWPGVSGARVGVLAGRTLPSLAALIYRSLTVAAALEERVFVVSHPLLRGVEEADAAGMDELEYVRRHRAALLVLRTLGRECCSGLVDTMICGRSLPPGAVPLRLAAEPRLTPCLHGAGCFRTDLTEADLIPAAEVHAGLVFAHSCSAVTVGVNAYPQEISVTLSLLEGTAVAVIGAMGMHVAQRGAERQLEADLAERRPLGDIVHRLSAKSHPLRGDLDRFGLLGDPGLIMPWTPATVRRRPTAPMPDRSGPRDAPLAALVHLDQTVLPRLERLRWLDVDLPEEELLAVRARIRAIARDPFDEATAAVVAGVVDATALLQLRTVERMITSIYTQGWNFGGAAFYGMEQISRTEVVCPSCATPRAVRLLMRHRVERSLRVWSLNCRRCADLWWSTGADAGVVLEPGRDVGVTRVRPVGVPFRVGNTGSVTVRGAVGFAFRNRSAFGLPSGWSRGCDLAPGAERTFEVPFDLRGFDPRPDTHTGPFVTLLDGIYSAAVLRIKLS
jgi:hypothetical protein